MDLQDPELRKPGRIARNARLVRRRFFPKLRRFAGRIPFADELLAAYFCAFDPATPSRVKAILLGALAYFIMPADLIPDIIAGLGFTDDLTVLSAAFGMVRGHVTSEHRQRAADYLSGIATEGAEGAQPDTQPDTKPEPERS
jgi:uncharacterized membrane protein YkvA (DUF1232 family)